LVYSQRIERQQIIASTKTMLAEMQEKADANIKTMLASMDALQARIKAEDEAWREKMMARIDAWLTDSNDNREEMMKWQDAMEANLEINGAKSRTKGGRSGVAGDF
jgi:hypothetical protein